MIDHYKTLGIPREASTAEIDKVFKLLAMKYHPDKNPKTATRFVEINTAHKILRNPLTRKHYDSIFIPSASSSKKTAGKILISGKITTPLMPPSDWYIQKHLSFCKMFHFFQLPKKNVAAQKVAEDFFISLNTQNIEAPFPPEFPEELSVTGMVTLFRQFLQKSIHPSHYPILKNYLDKQTKNAAFYPQLIELYRCFSNVVEMAIDPAYIKNLLTTLQPLFTWLQNNLTTDDAIGIFNTQIFVPLLQSLSFRKLTNVALEQTWQEPIPEMTLSDLHALFQCELDDRIKNEEFGSFSEEIYVLYHVQQDLQKDLKNDLTSEALRKVGFKLLDYMPVIKQSAFTTLNTLLYAAHMFLQASYREPHQNIAIADEALVTTIVNNILVALYKEHPFIKLYASIHCVALLSSLGHNHPPCASLKEKAKKIALKIFGMCPFYAPLQSYISLIKTTQPKFNQLYRKILDELEHYIRFEETSGIDEEKTLLEYPELDVLYESYQRYFRSWHVEPEPQSEQHLRLQLMEKLLGEKNWSFRDLDKNIHHRWIMSNQDDFGWRRLSDLLSFKEESSFYQIINGIKFDFNNGTFSLALTPWVTGNPPSKKVISHLDLRRTIQQQIVSAYFSLDNVSGKYAYHPYQNQVFNPPRLRKTGLGEAMLEADRLLKLFTTYYEVQNQYPYAIRSIETLIEPLPYHLKKIITDYRESKLPNSLSRLWITAGITPAIQTGEDHCRSGEMEFSFGETFMEVNKHAMIYDINGDLQDVKDDREGWHIYLLNDDQLQAVKDEKIKPITPALLMNKSNNAVYFYRYGIFNRPVFYPNTKLHKQLLEQPADKDNKILTLKHDEEKSQFANHHLLYHATREITKLGAQPHFFSAQRIFAEEMTTHYNEFCEYFPELERLKQLTRLTFVIKKMVDIRAKNKKILDTASLRLTDHANGYTSQLERLQSILKNLNDNYQKNLQGQIAHLQSSFDKMKALNLRAMSGQIHSQFKSVHATLLLQIGDTVFTGHINQLLAGNVIPLATAIVQQNFAQSKQNIKGTIKVSAPYAGENEINLFLSGNAQPLAQQIVNAQIGHVDQFQQDLKKAKILEQHFVKWGLGASLKNPDLSNDCTWIPASINRSDEGLVYGGVALKTQVVFKAQKHCFDLTFPLSTAFLADKIMDAKKFVKEMESLEFQLKLLNVSPYPVSQIIREVTEKVDSAQLQERRENADAASRGFYHYGLPQMSLADAFRGRTSIAGFHISRADHQYSVECAILKGEFNRAVETADTLDDESGTSIVRGVELMRLSQEIQGLGKKITQTCPVYTPDPVEPTASNTFLSTHDILQMTKLSVSQALSFFSNKLAKIHVANTPAPEFEYDTSPFPPGSVGAARAWSIKARLHQAGLPCIGKIRYVPPYGYTPTMPLPRKNSQGGYMDRFGNEWVPGSSRTPGHHKEWDVQLSSQGRASLKEFISDSDEHVNITLDGKFSH